MDAVILTAAGSSTRFGGTSKVLALLGGLPVVARALEPFRRVLHDAPVVVTARTEEVERLRALLPDVTVVAGGPSRQASVLRGLRALPQGVEHVLVHDAARPLATEALVRRTLEAVRRHGAAAAGLEVSDTLHRRTREGEPRLVATVDRAALFAVQTPQGARADWLREALEQAERAGREATDEATLLIEAGHPVAAVEGETENLKLTRPEDLALAEALLAARRSRGGVRGP